MPTEQFFHTSVCSGEICLIMKVNIQLFSYTYSLHRTCRHNIELPGASFIHRATVSSRSTLRDSNSKKQQTIPQQHSWKHNNMLAHCVAPLSATQTSLPANSISPVQRPVGKTAFPAQCFSVSCFSYKY